MKTRTRILLFALFCLVGGVSMTQPVLLIGAFFNCAFIAGTLITAYAISFMMPTKSRASRHQPLGIMFLRHLR